MPMPVVRYIFNASIFCHFILLFTCVALSPKWIFLFTGHRKGLEKSLHIDTNVLFSHLTYLALGFGYEVCFEISAWSIECRTVMYFYQFCKQWSDILNPCSSAERLPGIIQDVYNYIMSEFGLKLLDLSSAKTNA